MARKQHQKKPPLLSAEQEVAIQSGRAALADLALPRRTKMRVFVKLAINRITESNIGQSAAALAYYTLLSLFPLILFVANALPYFGLTYKGLAAYLTQAIPSNVMNWLDPVIANLLDSSSGGLLGIGAVATLWAARFRREWFENGLQSNLRRRVIAKFYYSTLIIDAHDLHTHHCDGRHSDCFRIWPPVSGMADPTASSQR